MLNLSHKKLDVYLIAMKLVKEVYTITREFPTEERYVLTSQLRRAAVSVCSNIAEGSSRKTKPEKRRFFEISRSSTVEIDTQIEIALRIEYLQKNQIVDLESCLERVFMMLTKLMEKLDAEMTTRDQRLGELFRKSRVIESSKLSKVESRELSKVASKTMMIKN
jgi:four helix bundle protein